MKNGRGVVVYFVNYGSGVIAVELGRVNLIVCHEAREDTGYDGLGGMARQGDRGYRQGDEERQITARSKSRGRKTVTKRRERQRCTTTYRQAVRQK